MPELKSFLFHIHDKPPEDQWIFSAVFLCFCITCLPFVLNILKYPRTFVAFAHDIAVAGLSFFGAYAVRYDLIQVSAFPVGDFWTLLLLSMTAKVVCFNLAGLYKGLWRFSSTPDLLCIIKASLAASLCSLCLIFFYNRLEGIPRSIFFLDWVFLIVGLGAGRFFYRWWKESWPLWGQEKKDTKILIVGAGSAGTQLIREIRANSKIGLKVVGLVDDAPQKLGRTLMGLEVLGSVQELDLLVERNSVKKVFIAIPSASGEQLRRIVHQVKKTSVKFKTLPPLSEILDDQVNLSLLRNINFEDFMGRETVKLDIKAIQHMFFNRRVMVTGAGGSIGAQLCRQIARLNPAQLICFEQSEFFLYQLEMELTENFPKLKLSPIIGNVRDYSKVADTFERYRPEIVLHASAYKHVPMMERNPMEAICTNVVGTQVVAGLAKVYAVDKFVMISTDKAVNPTNVMGCSKRVAEMICQHLGNQDTQVKYVTVRFGNVLGSSGSAVPLFQRQIEQRKDITITHPKVERYFMTISEASQLVLQAALMGTGGEVFVLDMGKSVKITSLVKEMVRAAGLKLDRDLRIKFIGLRPGEKLKEELFGNEEGIVGTAHRKVLLAKVGPLPDNFETLLSELVELPMGTAKEVVVEKLRTLVPGFCPTPASASKHGREHPPMSSPPL